MIAAALAVLATLGDPAGDAFGNGSLRPPNAAVYRDVAAFDLRGVRVVRGAAVSVEITLGSLPDPVGSPLGFSLPVIEVYLDTREGGRNDALPGSGMRLPPDRGWEFAIRATGDGASGFRSVDGGPPVELPVGASVDGDTVRIETPFALPERPDVYAWTGLYDALGDATWRPLTSEPSTWSFSSAEQRRPVIDVLAPTAEAQARAVDSGVAPRPRPDRPAAFYPVLMGLGLVIALVGLLLRRRVTPDPDAPPESDSDSGPDPSAGPGEEAPGDAFAAERGDPAAAPARSGPKSESDAPEPASTTQAGGSEEGPDDGASAPPDADGADADTGDPETRGTDTEDVETGDVGAHDANDADRAGAADAERRRPYGWNGEPGGDA